MSEGLRLLLDYHRIALPAEQLIQFTSFFGFWSEGRADLEPPEQAGLKIAQSSWEELGRLNLPVLAVGSGATFLINSVCGQLASVTLPFLFNLLMHRDWVEERWSGWIIDVRSAPDTGELLASGNASRSLAREVAR